jgi:predicted nucleotidyltransferase
VEDQLSAVAGSHGIQLIVQFGSTLTGRTNPLSDLDIGVLLERMPDGLDALVDLHTRPSATISGPKTPFL